MSYNLIGFLLQLQNYKNNGDIAHFKIKITTYIIQN